MHRTLLKGSIASLAALGALNIAGCAGPDLTTTMEPQAMQTAVTRARFEMNCPAATGTVLQKQVMQPLVQGVRFAGPERAQFTIGVEGCGQRTTMVVVCSDDNNGCFAGVGR